MQGWCEVGVGSRVRWDGLLSPCAPSECVHRHNITFAL